ncbi:hypothetical protein C8R45DRAFT_246447 [Mycena sanguinolenta]|nr:hypothetical protein C8R45DRAFT_246447 [Mycena sanguinolenta]
MSLCLDLSFPRNFLNAYNHMVIACAALNNDETLAESQTVDVGIFLKLVESRSHHTFIIDKVGLPPRRDTAKYAQDTNWVKGDEQPSNANHIKVMAGFCQLPNGRSEVQMWQMVASSVVSDILPPGFDLHRYITHVHRGITHFHASFWPLPRNTQTEMTDAEFEDVEDHPPEGGRATRGGITIRFVSRERWAPSGVSRGGMGRTRLSLRAARGARFASSRMTATKGSRS